MRLVISSGHGKYVPGANGPSPWGLIEVDEARATVELMATSLREAGHDVKVFHDDTSKNKDQNLKTIVAYHNGQQRDLDVSVHFNSATFNGSNQTSNPVGTECWYVTQAALAGKVSESIAIAGGLKNRGKKYTSSFYFLNNTAKPSVLIEVCFVNSKADADLYRKNQAAIAAAAAAALVGQESLPVPPPTGPDSEGRPTLRKGDEGPDVVYLQQQLNSDNNAGLATDGDFGSATDSAVRSYQASRRLDVDGIVGEQTWTALETDSPPYQPPALPPALSDAQIRAICDIAMTSPVASYAWQDRGKAPAGYTKGVALAFANTYRQMLMDYAPAWDMAKASTGNSDKDALSYYGDIFFDLDIDIDRKGVAALLALFTLLMGLGMRESSGKHCEGRDQSASNTTADTAEAGAWQTSYDARGGSSHFSTVFNDFAAGGGVNPQGFLEQFKDGVSCSSSSWQNYGSGNGAKHQQMSKEQPAYAAEVCAITLRNLRQHYGPINRMEAEVVQAAYDMLDSVVGYVDESEAVA
jgi:peptidoglycan hydrolase-like protein with peptidoglycan-binding domain